MADLIHDENIQQHEEAFIPIDQIDGDEISDQSHEEAFTSIEMGRLDPKWLNSVKMKVFPKPTEVPAPGSIESSISRVIRGLRQYNEDAYNPQLISIGPFHHGKPELRGMERQKWRYLHDTLSRIPSHCLEVFLDDVKCMEYTARRCYSEVINLDSNSFVEMMVLDACFILELFYKNCNEIDDPILDLKLMKKAVMADLVMIENQIPFFILQHLYVRLVQYDPYPLPLVKSAFLYFDELNSNKKQNMSPPHENSNFQHLLHLVYSSFSTKEAPRERERTVFKRIPCASKLEEGGVKFRVRKRHDINDDDGDFMDIRFDNGVLEIPPIEVWNKTYILFLNLIAFEQCNIDSRKFDSRKHISAYTAFMDCLINTSKDVEILCQEGIIDNGLGNEERVATLFNNMGRELTVYDDDFYLSGVCQKINAHTERRWPKLRASLVHDYFKNPWAIISFIGALVLLFLTTTQTFFSSFPKFAYG